MELIERAVAAYNGGIVSRPSKANPRGYVDYYKPEEAMKAAIRAMLDGVEPVAWRYERNGKVRLDDAYSEDMVPAWSALPLYSLNALKEAL